MRGWFYVLLVVLGVVYVVNMSAISHLNSHSAAHSRGTDAAAEQQLQNVRNYYDTNTRLFLFLGQGGTSLHRSLFPQVLNPLPTCLFACILDVFSLFNGAKELCNN